MILQFIRSKLKSQLGKDIIWTLIGQVIVMICGLAMNKILSCNLSVDDFGQYNVIRRSTSVLSFCLLAGLGITLPRYLAIYVNKLHFRRVKSLIFSSLVYMILNMAIVFIIYVSLKSFIGVIVSGTDSSYVFFLIFVYSLISACFSYLCAYYRGLGKFKQSNISHIVYQVILIIPLFFVANDIIKIFEFWCLLKFIILLSYIVVERKKFHYIKIRHVYNYYKKGDLKEISVYSIPRTIADFFLFTYSAFPLLYIGHKLGLQAVSFFSVGITLYTMATPIFSFLGVILLPLISKKVDKNSLNDVRFLVNRLLLIYMSLSIIIVFIIVIFMDTLIPLFFSSDYLISLTISKILVISVLPDSLYLLYRNPIDAISVKPYNTYILGICFISLIVGFIIANTLQQFACIYLGVAILRGVSSYIVWKVLLTKVENSSEISSI